MDNIDAWMNRALDGSSNSDSQKPTTPPEKRNFSRNNQNHKPAQPGQQNRPGQQPRPGQQSRPQPQGGQQNRPGQQPRPQQQGQQNRPGQQSRPQQQGQQNRPGQQPRPPQQAVAQQQQPQGTPQPQKPQQPRPPQTPQPNQQPAQQPRPSQQNKPSVGRAGQGGQRRDQNRQPMPSHGKPKPLAKAPAPIGKPSPLLRGKLKVIPLGGLNEVGKNMMALEYEDDIIILDMGLQFPDDDMFGIDYVVPDITYLEENKKRIRGVILTHGHLDHIGGIPFILPKLDFPPVYGTKLTMGLVKKRSEEFKQDKIGKFHVIDPDQTLKLGQFTCSFFRVTHSIPDCVGIVVDTPIGKVIDTGDFKFDATPAGNQQPADLHKMEALGSQNVLALFCESTNALKPGHSMSEKLVGETLDKIVGETDGRIIIASFSSQIGRIQQILDAAAKHDRQIFVSGRSMITNIQISAELGYLTFPKALVSDIKKYKNVADKKALILTTGSQGESVSALARMASGDHAHIKVKPDDTIILSSSPIIGNEKAIHVIINQLAILGANVINNELMEVHASGHGKQDELARMINYIKPKYLVPIHGEFFMRKGLANLAQEKCGLKPEQVIMLQNGDVLLAEKEKVYISPEKIDTKYILIDGIGEGKVGSQVQVDREIMSQNGALVVLVYVSRKTKKLGRPPDVVSRGFIYMHETDEITGEIIQLASKAYTAITEKNPGANRQDIKRYIRQTIDKYTHNKLERRPLVIPLIIES